MRYVRAVGEGANSQKKCDRNHTCNNINLKKLARIQPAQGFPAYAKVLCYEFFGKTL